MDIGPVRTHPHAEAVSTQFTPWPMVPGASGQLLAAGLISVAVVETSSFRTIHAWFDPATGITVPVRRGHADPQRVEERPW